MSANKKLLFISHSSADKKNVDEIYNYLKDVVKIKEHHGFEIVYSSANDPTDKLKSMKLKETILQIPASTVCIAYITWDYLESDDCLLELGAALAADFGKKNGKKLMSGTELLPIKDSIISSHELGTLSELVNRKVDDNLINDIGTFLGIKISLDHKRKFRKVVENIEKNNNAKHAKLDIKKAVSDIKKFITRTFNNHSRLSDKPVIIYVDRPIYESLSMELAKIGNRMVLWTLYRSPLKNKFALKQKNKITDYELFFNTLRSPKIRLIIFENNEEAKEYLNKELTPQLKARKKAFEAMNRDCLYYTTVSNIRNAYKKHGNTREHIPEIGKDLFYEFAYLKSGEFDFCIFSEFSSEKQTTYTTVHPLVFIKATESTVQRFDSNKYRDSSLLSIFISHEFDFLLKNEIIKKYVKKNLNYLYVFIACVCWL